MQALIKDTPEKGYTLKELPIPEPKDDEVLIKVEKVAICGSDIALFVWNEIGRLIATLPFIPGHEATGKVVKAGPKATISIGSRVAVENHFFCGDCYTCKEGRGDICQRMDQYGHGRGTMHGGCSQFSIVPSKYCYQLKHNITTNEAVLLEPMGVAMNGIESMVGGVEGKDILIIGGGPIGLLATAICKAKGASIIIVADIMKSRLNLAKKMGANVVIDCTVQNLHDEIMTLTGGIGVSRLMECSGSQCNAAFSLLRKGAHLVLIGLPQKTLQVEQPTKEIVFKSITMSTIHGRRIFSTWEKCEKMIAEKKVDLNMIVSHEFPMSKWVKAFEALVSKDSCKIIMDPQQ